MPEDERNVRNLPKDEPGFRELTKVRDFDRQMHIQKCLEMGMTREEAERHADEHVRERDEST